MTVAFDAVASNSVASNSGNTLTWTHTPAGTPSAVAVGVQNYDSIATITGITYGGVSMVQAETVTMNNGSTVQMWGLANPPAGAQTVAITLSATGGYTQAGSITVTGSSTSTCFRASNSAFGTGASSSVIVTSAVGDDLPLSFSSTRS